MPGDWIKMRTDLYRDPKVCVMADLLADPDGDLARFVSQHCQRDMTVTRNVTRCATVGALVTVWGVMRHRGKRNADDLIVRGVTAGVVDDIADLPGFGAAMIAVNWLIENDDGLTFPRFFEELNTEPGVSSKGSAAERQRRYRERQKAKSDASPVTSPVTSRNDREEESREEKKEKKKTPLAPRQQPGVPAVLDTPEFLAAWQTWSAHRAEIRKKLTPTTAAAQLKKLAALGPARAVRCIEHTIEKGWTGLREPDAPDAAPAGKPAVLPLRPATTFEMRHATYNPQTGFLRDADGNIDTSKLCGDPDCEHCKPRRAAA